MALNIKNERVHALAREASRLTGKNQTSAIEEALELLLRSYGADPHAARVAGKVDRVTRFVHDYADDRGNEHPTIRTVEDLYDEATGLPR